MLNQCRLSHTLTFFSTIAHSVFLFFSPSHHHELACLVNRGNAFTTYLASKRPTPRRFYTLNLWTIYIRGVSPRFWHPSLSLFLRLPWFFLHVSFSPLSNNFKREKSMISGSTLLLSTVAPVDTLPREQLSSPSLAFAHFSLRVFPIWLPCSVIMKLLLRFSRFRCHYYVSSCCALYISAANGRRKCRLRHTYGAPKCHVRISFVTITQFSSNIDALTDFRFP